MLSFGLIVPLAFSLPGFFKYYGMKNVSGASWVIVFLGAMFTFAGMTTFGDKKEKEVEAITIGGMGACLIAGLKLLVAQDVSSLNQYTLSIPTLYGALCILSFYGFLVLVTIGRKNELASTEVQIEEVPVDFLAAEIDSLRFPQSKEPVLFAGPE